MMPSGFFIFVGRLRETVLAFDRVDLMLDNLRAALAVTSGTPTSRTKLEGAASRRADLLGRQTRALAKDLRGLMSELEIIGAAVEQGSVLEQVLLHEEGS